MKIVIVERSEGVTTYEAYLQSTGNALRFKLDTHNEWILRGPLHVNAT